METKTINYNAPDYRATATLFRDIVDDIRMDFEDHNSEFELHQILIWENLNAYLSYYVTQLFEQRMGICDFCALPDLHINWSMIQLSAKFETLNQGMTELNHNWR